MMKWKNLLINITYCLIIVFITALTLIGSFFTLSAKMSADDDDIEANRLFPREPLTDGVNLQFDFFVDSLCRIADPTRSLDAFLNELEMLLAGKDTVVNIVHLGDSHVQAGFYTGQIMNLLQETFGNAGRGWISPLKLAKVNEPKDYFITSNVKNWEIGRCIQKEPLCPLGPGAMGLRTHSGKVDFAVRVAPESSGEYAFNQLILYRDNEAIPMMPVHADTTAVHVSWGIETHRQGLVADTFRIAEKVDVLQLHSVSTFDPAQPSQHANCYYGFSLANGCAGILYHAIGQNGAMFVNYSRPEYIRQLALLKPSLLIVTLGTNEAFARPRFNVEQFVAEMDTFVRLINAYLPNTAMLITTPAESFRRVRTQYKRNQTIQQVATAINEYVEREGIACFDLYTATGGVSSCENWEKANLLGRDRVHYSIEGYHEQGKLLYKALVRLKLNQKNELRSGMY